MLLQKIENILSSLRNEENNNEMFTYIIVLVFSYCINMLIYQ